MATAVEREMIQPDAAQIIAAARELDRVDIAGLRDALDEIKYVLLERKPRNGPRPYDFNERAFAWAIAEKALRTSDAARSVEIKR